MDEPPIGIVDYDFYGIPISAIPLFDIGYEIFVILITIVTPWMFTRKSSEATRRRHMRQALLVYLIANAARFLPRLLMSQ